MRTAATGWQMSKAWLKRHGWEVLLLAAAAILLFWWLGNRHGEAGSFAVVSYDGRTVMEIPLDRDGFYALEEDPTVRFEVKDGAVAFVDATCPDKVCEKEGFLSRDGEMAVCLPRKTSLRVVAGEQDAPDIVAR